MNGNSKHEGVIGALTDLCTKLVTVLPPAIVSLILLNIVFLAVVFWFLHTQYQTRAELIGRMLEACIAHKRGDW